MGKRTTPSDKTTPPPATQPTTEPGVQPIAPPEAQPGTQPDDPLAALGVIGQEPGQGVGEAGQTSAGADSSLHSDPDPSATEPPTTPVTPTGSDSAAEPANPAPFAVAIDWHNDPDLIRARIEQLGDPHAPVLVASSELAAANIALADGTVELQRLVNEKRGVLMAVQAKAQAEKEELRLLRIRLDEIAAATEAASESQIKPAAS